MKLMGRIRKINMKIDAWPSNDSIARPDKTWLLTRPKDLLPETFDGKEEYWVKWKEDIEDYTDSVNKGTKDILRMISKAKVEIDEKYFRDNGMPDLWATRDELFKLLKNKTSGDGRGLIMGVGRDNGWEAWRSLTLRYEPQVGLRRMRELGELNALQNKRCKNAAETMLVVLEIDRRRRIIDEIRGPSPRQ